MPLGSGKVHTCYHRPLAIFQRFRSTNTLLRRALSPIMVDTDEGHSIALSFIMVGEQYAGLFHLDR
jgi:hypothetical protein